MWFLAIFPHNVHISQHVKHVPYVLRLCTCPHFFHLQESVSPQPRALACAAPVVFSFHTQPSPSPFLILCLYAYPRIHPSLLSPYQVCCHECLPMLVPWSPRIASGRAASGFSPSGGATACGSGGTRSSACAFATAAAPSCVPASPPGPG